MQAKKSTIKDAIKAQARIDEKHSQDLRRLLSQVCQDDVYYQQLLNKTLQVISDVVDSRSKTILKNTKDVESLKEQHKDLVKSLDDLEREIGKISTTIAQVSSTIKSLQDEIDVSRDEVNNLLVQRRVVEDGVVKRKSSWLDGFSKLLRSESLKDEASKDPKCQELTLKINRINAEIGAKISHIEAVEKESKKNSEELVLKELQHREIIVAIEAKNQEIHTINREISSAERSKKNHEEYLPIMQGLEREFNVVIQQISRLEEFLVQEQDSLSQMRAAHQELKDRLLESSDIIAQNQQYLQEAEGLKRLINLSSSSHDHDIDQDSSQARSFEAIKECSELFKNQLEALRKIHHERCMKASKYNLQRSNYYSHWSTGLYQSN